jgi:hypothetical protein
MRQLRTNVALRAIALLVLMLHIAVPAVHAAADGHVVHGSSAVTTGLSWHSDQLAAAPAHPAGHDGSTDDPQHPCKLCQLLSANAPLLSAPSPDLPPIMAAVLAASAPCHDHVGHGGSNAAFEARGPPVSRQALA